MSIMNPEAEQKPEENPSSLAKEQPGHKPRPKRRNTRPPIPDDFKELCEFCRAGKLFAVQAWFKQHQYEEPDDVPRRYWPMGIAIESGFHSLVEVLLRNGIPADANALSETVWHRRVDFVELLFENGADPKAIPFADVVSAGNLPVIKLFLARGVDLVEGYPFYHGLIHQTRMWLGIYKQHRTNHPELQLQADMALRHFAQKGSLRGVSLLMWLGANPRTKVQNIQDESEEFWNSALEEAAWEGKLDIIKRLKPDPAKDDVNYLLRRSVFCRNMELVRYWISMGANINHLDSEGGSAHREVFWHLNWDLDPKSSWFGTSRSNDTRRFAQEWFSLGAKWIPQKDDFRTVRRCFSNISPTEAHELIKLFREKEVIPAESLAKILDTPRLREHLKERHAAIVSFVPQLAKWVKADLRAQSRAQMNDRSRAKNSKTTVSDAVPPPDPYRSYRGEHVVRQLSDE